MKSKVKTTVTLLLLTFMYSISAASVYAASITKYKVFGVNDLGMHCVDDDFSTLTILPPFNVVQGQIIGIDSNGNPKVLSPGDNVTLTYRATPDPSGSVNSSWRDKNDNPKTNFWTYQGAYGLSLLDGQGIFGLYMPKDTSKLSKKTFSWISGENIFKAPGIPILPIDDDGKKNYYPMLQLEARDAITKKVLVRTKVVLPVSDETTCENCHTTGKSAADSSKYPSISWSTNTNSSIQYRENVLKLHDYKFTTVLESSKPVLCAGCHYSPALDLTGSGPNEEQQKHRTMSAVMHDNHADKMVLDGKPLLDAPVPPGGVIPDPAQQSCYQCHPGAKTQCLRGAMTQNITCQNCHGNMAAVGGRYPLIAGGSLDGTNDGKSRRPWTDLPRCQSCHTGDEKNHLPTTPATSSDGLRLYYAFDPSDLSASPRLARNKRFAEEQNTLFKHSKGHGGILCENCHGSTHAIWPGGPKHPNDDVAAVVAQGHAGTIIECKTCHKNSLKLSMNGPHGLHNVNDSKWVNGGHGNFYEKKPASCKTCHGRNLRGSPLGKVAVKRKFVTEDFGTKVYKKGDEVTCYDCHNGPQYAK